MKRVRKKPVPWYKVMHDIDFLCFQESNQIVCEKHLELGATLRGARKARGLTLEQLGAKIGYSPMAMSKWERNL